MMWNALDRSFGVGTNQHCEIVTVWTLWVRRFLLHASTAVENYHPISLSCIWTLVGRKLPEFFNSSLKRPFITVQYVDMSLPNTWLTLTFQFKMTAESWPMESCTGQWLPGFPYVESVHSSLHWMQNIFSGFFVLDIIRGKAAVLLGLNWTKMWSSWKSVLF